MKSKYEEVEDLLQIKSENPLMASMKIKESSTYLGAAQTLDKKQTWTHVRSRVGKARAAAQEMKLKGFHHGRQETSLENISSNNNSYTHVCNGTVQHTARHVPTHG